MQLVFEFGSRGVGPTIDAIRRTIGKRVCTIECLPKGSDTYAATDDSLESAATKLELGDISAFSLQPEGGMIRYALVFGPFFGGEPLSLYFGTIEYTGRDYVSIWESLLGTPGLIVASLGYEEGVELQDSHLTVESFPWNKWPLAIGALRIQSDSGSWVIREGPELKWLTHSG